MHWRYSPSGVCGGTGWEEQVRVVRRAAALMRTPPFSDWFPARHVAWWEQASLDDLFHARVVAGWPLLGRWCAAGGWRARLASCAVRGLSWLSRRRERMRSPEC
jgi:hypothetical protein